MGAKRALVVGIDDYPKIPLGGCVADATAMAERLARNADDSRNFDVHLVVSPARIDRDRLRRELEKLFDNCRGADLLFYFSGHGIKTAFGAELLAADLNGVGMGDLLNLATGSAAESVTLLLDCCFSGNAGNPAVLQANEVAEQFRRDISLLSEGVTVLAASRPTELAVETNGHGVFTRLLLDGLDGGATDHTGRVTPLSLYAFASPALGSWDQRPIFKAHLTEPPILRAGPPWLEAPLLRQLTQHFRDATERVTMTPEHEGKNRPFRYGEGTVQQRQFDYFKRLRNAGLLATDDDEDLYFVALNGHDAYLTALGRYFWDRAKQGLI